DEDAVSPGYGFDNNRRDRVRPFELNNLFGAGENFVCRFRFFIDAMVKLGNPKDSRDARLGSPAARVAGQRERARGAAVIRAITRADFVTPGEQTRDADCVLVRFGAAIGKEKRVNVTRSYLRELCTETGAHLSGHERIGVREHLRLFLDGANDSLVAMPDIDAHQLAVEVDVALIFRCPEVDALGARDGNRIHRGLGGPFEERVPATEFDDFFAGHGFSCY